MVTRDGICFSFKRLGSYKFSRSRFQKLNVTQHGSQQFICHEFLSRDGRITDRWSQVNAELSHGIKRGSWLWQLFKILFHLRYRCYVGPEQKTLANIFLAGLCSLVKWVRFLDFVQFDSIFTHQQMGSWHRKVQFPCNLTYSVIWQRYKEDAITSPRYDSKETPLTMKGKVFRGIKPPCWGKLQHAEIFNSSQTAPQVNFLLK